MRGDLTVIDYLNKALRHELTAVNQYWLHYRLLDNWGYTALAKRWRKESIEEMQHADKIIERIIFLARLWPIWITQGRAHLRGKQIRRRFFLLSRLGRDRKEIDPPRVLRLDLSLTHSNFGQSRA